MRLAEKSTIHDSHDSKHTLEVFEVFFEYFNELLLYLT